MAEPANDRGPSLADARAEIAANRERLRRDDRRAVRAIVAWVLAIAVVLAVLGWKAR